MPSMGDSTALSSTRRLSSVMLASRATISASTPEIASPPGRISCHLDLSEAALDLQATHLLRTDQDIELEIADQSRPR